MLEHFTTPRGNPARLYIRPDTNDHNTAWSCLNEDEYQLPPLSGVAWDIGAYIGAVTIALLLDNPDLRVVAVEPVPANVTLAWQNFQANGVEKRVSLIAGAVGVGGEEVTVGYNYAGSEPATHHAYVGNLTLVPAAMATEHVTYPAIGVPDLLAWHGIPSLVKIDTEGAEWQFLSGDNSSLPLIVGEWHQVGGTRGQFRDLLYTHDVTFSGPAVGPGGFRAVL